MPKGRSAAVDWLAKGTFQRQDFSQTETFVANTEVAVTSMSDYIVAGVSNEAMFSWIRWTGFIYDTAKYSIFEYAVIRQDAGEGMPDLNNESDVEVLLREKRILERDFVMQPDPNYGRLRELDLEFFNVKLLPNEELRLIIRPLVAASGASQSLIQGIVEWRQVGE